LIGDGISWCERRNTVSPVKKRRTEVESTASTRNPESPEEERDETLHDSLKLKTNKENFEQKKRRTPPRGSLSTDKNHRKPVHPLRRRKKGN